ncbi:rhodanese-like domain-containing protein [Paenibacillus alginolyticus]|jgi:rhodanese-related sulfurtransferase|uniref:Rhodanese-like domain-containing protein n=1 Tax=Paenibacillus alginolyticus TaxID=59839 RepID=A0ABT4GJ78_9BACL|nr:rhodanese-like domain-containing protein [Paenibacillus alginolyticus]MCY9668063.1 rhodanese-like domain-containing protein [Paenibacillus alginolyticus]MCY9696259.1 rhodanese-like domain-containing protein [Paenibacillus alginolyticus]MEC0142534.1 rhodanese-like domain-containing protein [Paenibacillus alginolyticus]
MDTILPSEIKKRLDLGEQLAIVDVREDDEVAAGIIQGAIHIPLAQLPDRLSEIPQVEELILVCRSGNRSGRAISFLEAQGYKGLKNMTGGMLEWED